MLAVATVNALAEMCWRRRPAPEAELRSGVDAYDAAGIGPGDKVVMVGAFVPFLKALKRRRQRWTALEMDAATLKPDEMAHFRPADAAASVVPGADVVLITGTTLLNDTLDGLLKLCRRDARVVVVGPTVGLFPDAFLRRGVSVMGGIRITALGFDGVARGVRSGPSGIVVAGCSPCARAQPSVPGKLCYQK